MRRRRMHEKNLQAHQIFLGAIITGLDAAGHQNLIKIYTGF